MDQDLVSFVIRFVREAADDQQARWRGVIKHVQSNGEANFTQFSEAVSFMQGFVNDVVQEGFEQSKRASDAYGAVNPFRETTRLWGNFMPSYMKTMMDSMGEAMDGVSAQDMTRPMEQAMDSAMRAWGLSTQAEQVKTAAALEAMTRQLAEMTAKLADLENQIADLKD